MQDKLFYEPKYGTGHYTKNGKPYDFEVHTLPQVGSRKSYGIYPIGGFLVKFAQVEDRKFFSYEIRFTQTAIRELDIGTPDHLKAKSIAVVTKILEQSYYDDMIVTVRRADDYVAHSSVQPLAKHRLYYKYKSENF